MPTLTTGKRIDAPRGPINPVAADMVIDSNLWVISTDPVKIGNPVPGEGYLTAVHLNTTGDLICVGTEDGFIYESLDGGQSWAVGLDLEDTDCRINAFCDFENGTVYACCNGGSGYGRIFYRDTDGVWSTVHTSTEKDVTWITTFDLTGPVVAATMDTSNNAKIWSGTTSFTLRLTLGCTVVLGPCWAPYGSGVRLVVVGGESADQSAYYSSDGVTWTTGAAIPSSLIYQIEPRQPAAWFDWLSQKSLVSVVRRAPISSTFHFYTYDMGADTWTQEDIDFAAMTTPVNPIVCLFSHKGFAYLTLCITDYMGVPTGQNMILKRIPAFDGTNYLGKWIHYWDGGTEWLFSNSNRSIGVISGVYTPELRLFVPDSSVGHRYVYATSRRQMIYG